MNFNLNDIYKMFNDLKEKHDFKEYFDEIEDNNKILSENPFNMQRAQEKISELTGKYRFEINMLARFYGNGKSVTNQPVSKMPADVWDDLQYINQHIPLFALERKGISDFLIKKSDSENRKAAEKTGGDGVHMAEWNAKRIDEIVEFNPHESLKKGVFAKKVAMDKLQPFCRDILGFELEPFSGGTKFRNGDTIMARITPCLENGKIAKINILDNGEVGFGSTEYIVFRARQGFDEEFVYYLISSPLIREPAIKSMVGSSGRQRVQTDVLKNITVMVPELGEQRSIAGVLKLLEDKIAVNKKINDNLLQQIQLLYGFLAEELNGKPVELSSVVDVRDGTHDSPKPKETGFPLVTSRHLLPFGVDLSSTKFISLEDYNKINKRSKVDTYDILLSMIGTVGLISLVIENPVKYAIKNVGLFKTSNCPDLYAFILPYLRSAKTTQHIERTLAGSTQKYISLSELRKMPIVLPSEDQLRDYNKVAIPLIDQITNLTEENKLLASFRDALLPKLMSGELDVTGLDI